jgi:rod shape-determining protein MreD
VVIQIAFFEHLKIFYLSADLVLVAVIAVAVFDGGLYGLLYGFTSGLLIDLIAGKITGVNAMIYATCGFFASKLIEMGLKKKTVNHLLIIFFFTELSLILYSAMYYLFNLNLNFARLGIETVVGPVCNILLMFLVFPLINAGGRKKEEIGFAYKDKI